MEWMAILELLKDDNLSKILSEYTLAIGFVGGVVGGLVMRTPNKFDDKVWDAVKRKFPGAKK